MEKHIYEAVVIGSGPTGVISAQKLLSKNIKTLVIDYGKTIEEATNLKIKRLRNIDSDEWNNKNLKILHGNKKTYLSKVPLKLLFGSSFMYAFNRIITNISFKNVDYITSLAKGGLSNVWGGAILPYRKEDFKDWPIKIKDLEKYYKYVLDNIGFTYFEDDLEKLFPKYSNNISKLDISNQISRLEHVLNKNKNLLNKKGFFFGRSRIAIDQSLNKCIYCGGCLYGCPKSIIYNSSNSLDQLINNNKIDYKNNLLVIKLIEEKNNVIIICKDKNDKLIKIISRRVYLGAGAISSTKIILNSYNNLVKDKKIFLKDSQYFFIPAFINYSQPFINKDKLHTLSQIFLEYRTNSEGKNWSHFQIYGYNDILRNTIKRKLGPLYFIFQILIERFLLDKLIFIQGYLHSDLSRKASLNIKYTKDELLLEVEQIDNNFTIKHIRNLVSILKKNSKLLGFFPIKKFLSIGNFGRGFHIGGSLSMSLKNDDIGKSDIWGRPFKFNRVHVIDSAVMPTIASTTITLTSMANAVRIVDNHEYY